MKAVSAGTMQINSTEVAGLLAFIPAALAGGVAATRTRARAGEGTLSWGVIGVVHVLLAAEVLATTRYVVGDWLRQLLTRANEYSSRREPQAVALFLIVAVAIVISFVIVRRAPSRAPRVASAATAAAVTVFIVESVSLHGVDAILYTPAGPILLIGWLWLACGWSSAIASAAVRR